MTIIDVDLRPRWVERVGYRYDGLLDGEMIVHGSRDPEHDIARVLEALGYRGRFRTIDAFSGRPRMTHHIGTAAKLCAVERDALGVMIVPYRPMSEADKSRARLQRTRQGSPERARVVSDTRRQEKRAGGKSAAAKRGDWRGLREDREAKPASLEREDA